MAAEFFSEDEIDVFREIMNLHIGEAAALLSDMVDRKIILAVPDVRLIRLGNDATEVKAGLRDIFNGQVISSSLGFGEELTGRAYFVIPSFQARPLVDLCLGRSVSKTSENVCLPFLDEDIDVIQEIGNVILNSIIGGFSNLMGLRLYYYQPEVEIFDFN